MARLTDYLSGAGSVRDREYKPGDKVQYSGVYNVKHDRTHKTEHQVTAVEGKKFPPCRTCGKGVTYKLFKAAVHLHTHKDYKHES